MDPARTPVLVGVGQVEQRIDDPSKAKEPLDLMRDATDVAAEDCGRRDLLAKAETVYVVQGAWRYGNPARVVAYHIGASKAQTVGTPFGGNMVQACVNDAGRRIAEGEADVAVLAGAECGRTRARAKKAGVVVTWDGAEGQPDRTVGSFASMIHDFEQVHGIVRPSHIYAMFENAIRYQKGEDLDGHRSRIASLWSRMSDIAADNPHAWIRDPAGPDEIATPSASNRMIGFPYPKLMNSNNGVDQGAALVICSLATAEAAGVDPSRFVFLHSGTDGYDPIMVSNRDTFYESPAIRLAGRRALELAHRSADDIDHVDVYSCFPSAVQVGATELGLSQERPLSVTGGLTFGGGPLNNYVMHSIATMAEKLRDDRGSRGLVTANGGYLSKHAFGVYSTDPADDGFQYENLQPKLDALPTREIVDDYAGPVELESYTVDYDGDGPARALVSCRLPNGTRAWGASDDRGLAQAMTEEEFCGRSGERTAKGVFSAA